MIEILAAILTRRQQVLRSHAVVFWRGLTQLSDRLFDTIVRRRPRRAAAGFLAAGALAAGGLMVTVHSGNTLSGIAAAHCSGHSNDWTGIYEQNRAVIGANPNLIQPGQHLRIKCTDPAYLLRLGSGSSGNSSTGHAGGTFQAQGPAPSVSGGVYSYSALEALWVSAGGPSWAEAHAAEIAECESGGRVDAFNPSGATGLWQILGAVVAGNLDNPYTNALNAVSKFTASGDTFAQWVCQ